MTELIGLGVAAALIITFADALAPRVRTAPPLILVVAGILLSFIPGLGAFELEPDIILEVILPPLLFAAAVSMPAMSFRRELPSISGLAVILVLISSLGLGLVFSLLVPGLGFVWGAALGAILSPTDAVATSIIKGKGVPDRVVTILEGESLFNDATSLVILATAIGATVHAFSPAAAVGSFAYSVVVAVLVGGVAGLGTMWVRRRLESPEAGTLLSFTVPFIASVPTEMLGASGLVAAVVAGLITGFRGPRELPAQHRLTSADTWRSAQMVLEGFVFLTMGLQFRAVLRGLHVDGVGIGVGIGLAVLALAVVLVVRSAWMVPQLWYASRRARRGHDMQPRIERMQERLETGRRLTEQQLEGWEKVQAQLEGIEDPTHEQLSAAWRTVLQEMADQGDDLARRRLELHEKAVALQETDPIERGDAAAWRRRYEHLASDGAGASAALDESYQQGVRLATTPSRRNAARTARRIAQREAHVRGHRGRRARDARILPDPEQLARYTTRLRRASADIGYLVRQPLGTREGAVLVWAGMRGAVTVAAAQALPDNAPHRELLVFIAFAVATLSLLVQGGTIGMLARRLFSSEPTQAEADHQAEQHQAILALMDAAASEAEVSLAPDASGKERDLAVLDAQRSTLLDARDDGLFDADAIQHALAVVDAEEIALSMRGGPQG